MNRLVYFEQIAGSARKFYLMTEDDGGSTFTANYGRIGTTGSVKTYPMSKWQHVYNTRIQHGYTDKTRDYLAGRTSLSPKTKPVDGIKYNITVAEDAIVCKNAVIGDDAYYTSRFTKL